MGVLTDAHDLIAAYAHLGRYLAVPPAARVEALHAEASPVVQRQSVRDELTFDVPNEQQALQEKMGATAQSLQSLQYPKKGPFCPEKVVFNF